MHGYLFWGKMQPYTALLGTARLFILGNAACTFLIWITFNMWIYMQAYTTFSVRDMHQNAHQGKIVLPL